MSDLLPCPFCGSAAKACYFENAISGYWEIECINCNTSFSDDTLEETAAKWNRRPLEDALRQRIDELEHDLVLAFDIAYFHGVEIDYNDSAYHLNRGFRQLKRQESTP